MTGLRLRKRRRIQTAPSPNFVIFRKNIVDNDGAFPLCFTSSTRGYARLNFITGEKPLHVQRQFISGKSIIMAFAIRNLSVLAYANGFTLWHYKSPKDTLENVAAANYMADASDMLTAGDLIMVTAADGARIICVTLADIETAITAPLC